MSENPNPEFPGADTFEVDQLAFENASLRTTIEEQARKIAELEAEREWKPIETCPKDKWVIAYLYPYEPFIAKLDQSHGWVDEREHGIYSPTHWMPLPEPPKEE